MISFLPKDLEASRTVLAFWLPCARGIHPPDEDEQHGPGVPPKAMAPFDIVWSLVLVGFLELEIEIPRRVGIVAGGGDHVLLASGTGSAGLGMSKVNSVVGRS